MSDEALQKDVEYFLNNMAVWTVSAKFRDGRPPLGARYITTTGASDDEIVEGVKQITGKILAKLKEGKDEESDK